jgi:hypothetical protein
LRTGAYYVAQGARLGGREFFAVGIAIEAREGHDDPICQPTPVLDLS